MRSYVTVSVEVDLSEILDDLDDDELEQELAKRAKSPSPGSLEHRVDKLIDDWSRGYSIDAQLRDIAFHFCGRVIVSQ